VRHGNFRRGSRSPYPVPRTAVLVDRSRRTRAMANSGTIQTSSPPSGSPRIRRAGRNRHGRRERVRAMEISARNQTVAEEIANSLSHGLGSIAALIVAAWLLLPSARQGSATSYLATSVFA